MAEVENNGAQQGSFEPLYFARKDEYGSCTVGISWCAYSKTIGLNVISGRTDQSTYEMIKCNGLAVIDLESARHIAELLLEAADRAT